jgi:prolyl-tRNA synthetase
MGCYGIGVNRILASFIENSYDANGIIWNKSISPYEVLMCSVKPEDERIARISNILYTQLSAKGIEVLWDDRDLSAGIKFKDGDLIGIPIRIIVGKNALDKQMVDLKLRKEDSQKSIPITEVVSEILELPSPISL